MWKANVCNCCWDKTSGWVCQIQKTFPDGGNSTVVVFAMCCVQISNMLLLQVKICWLTFCWNKRVTDVVGLFI